MVVICKGHRCELFNNVYLLGGVESDLKLCFGISKDAGCLPHVLHRTVSIPEKSCASSEAEHDRHKS